jgi:LytS/YehU family sensor histidine kinase
LEKEVVFIRHFIALMKIRLSDNVKIIEQYPDSSEIIGIDIAPLLFITLIENAFKHGVSATHHSEIIINMRIENNLLIFVVQNNNYPKNREDKGGSGVGMENLRSRLQKLYPNKYDLHQQLVNNHFTTSLTLNL